jgi:hypothetical protein
VSTKILSFLQNIVPEGKKGGTLTHDQLTVDTGFSNGVERQVYN